MSRLTKTTTDELIQLDIRRLTKAGFTKVGSSGTMTWRRGAVTIGTLQCTGISLDTISLNYGLQPGNQEGSTTQHVHLESTPCNLGGHRRWFLCPDCQRRVAILYFADGAFKCRHCQDLAYQSQNETDVARKMRKARKIRSRLKAPQGLFQPVLEKPKGMHYKTFDRLLLAELKANAYLKEH